MREYQLYLFDLDGTLWRGDTPIPSAVDAVKRLQTRGAKVHFLTNNSSQTVESYAAKLNRLGFAASPDEVGSSATATAAHLVEIGAKSVQVLGEPGLVETLRRAGLTVQSPDEEWPTPAEVVVVGIFREFSYGHLSKAMASIRAGSQFIATNLDPTFPMEAGRVVPGSGSIVAAVRTCAEVEPFVVGKPGPTMLRVAMRQAGVSPEETLVIGDRMDTDIASGVAAGCDTLLVLTGVTTVAPEGQPWMETLEGL